MVVGCETGLVLNRNPVHAALEPVVVVVEGLYVLILDGVEFMACVKRFLEFVLPTILGDHVDQLLYNRRIIFCCHNLFYFIRR